MSLIIRRVVVLLPLFLGGLTACRPPESLEIFRKGPASAYVFPLDLSDSTRSYDLFFYTRVARPVFGRDSLPASFPIHVRWEGPSGQCFEETLCYPTSEIRVPYRSGLVMAEYGVWTLTATLPPPSISLPGLGLICRYGTR